MEMSEDGWNGIPFVLVVSQWMAEFLGLGLDQGTATVPNSVHVPGVKINWYDTSFICGVIANVARELPR